MSAGGRSQAGIGAGMCDYYHGTPPSQMLKILEQGFKPTIGAGAYQLYKHFQLPVPVAYMANNYGAALQYPIWVTSREHYGGSHKGISGGRLMATDDTYPMHCVIRCMADP